MKAPFHAPLSLTVLTIVAGALGGCTTDMTGYPSLAPRTIENDARAGTTPATAEPAVAAPGGTSPALAKLIDDAGKADAAFQAALAASRRTIESGSRAAMGSEAWIASQQAYSALDAARAPVTVALAELDKLRQQAVSNGDDETPVATATQQVQAIDEAERAVLAQLAPSAD